MNYRNTEIQIMEKHKYKLPKYRNKNCRSAEIQIEGLQKFKFIKGHP